jgi:hypothetical protein
MAFTSSAPELLVLHAVRIKGMADTGEVARRFSLGRDVVEELLLDYEASGWVQRVAFADARGWTLTEAGRAENGRRLSAELEETGAHDPIAASHSTFVKLNARLLSTVTNWQIRPTSWDAMASNDHDDTQWDDRVLNGLAGLLRRLRPVCAELTETLARFAGYPERLEAALEQVDHGQRAWVDQPGMDSFHTVWMELHEDLLATLGLERGQGA